VHRPHEPLDPITDARFALSLDAGELVLPSDPIDLPTGTMARWPVGLEVGGVLVRWATASAVTVLDGDLPTLVLLAADGVRVELAVGDDDLVGHEPPVEPVRHRFGALDVLVLPASDAHRLWVPTVDGSRRLLRCDHPLWVEDGSLVVRASAEPVVEEWDAAAGAFRRVPFEAEARTPVTAAVTAIPLRPAADVPARYGGTPQRTAAPGPARVAELASAFVLDGLPDPRPGVRRVLTVDWAGDVATVEVDGEVVADRFWDGTPWHVDLDAIDGTPPRTVILRILPLHPEAPVRLDEHAAARRDATPGALCALDAVTVEQSVRWRERS
jgi:hypothetical protein